MSQNNFYCSKIKRVAENLLPNVGCIIQLYFNTPTKTTISYNHKDYNKIFLNVTKIYNFVKKLLAKSHEILNQP
jgi:hypothetical protein